MEARHLLHGLFEPASVLLVVGDERPRWLRSLGEGLEQAVVPLRVVDLQGRPVGRHSRQAAREELPPAAGMALIAVAPPEVPRALVLAASRGARWATLMSTPGDRAQAGEWLAQARALGMRVLGPATLGYARPALRLNAGRAGALPAAGGVALVSQSGTLNAAVLDGVADYAPGFSLVVSVGAEADVDMAQVLDFLSADAQTEAVVVYLEAVTRARSFMSALRALALLKPVIVLKGHRDEHAPWPALTHSGALWRSDAVYAAALRRAGAIPIRYFQQMFTSARVLATQPGPLGRRLGVIANGKGPAVLLADLVAQADLALPEPGAPTRALLAGLPGPPGREPANPVDLGIDATPADYTLALRALAADPVIDGIVVALAPHRGVDVEGITRAVITARAELRKPLFACWMGEHRLRSLAQALEAAGVPAYAFPEGAIDACATVFAWHENQRLLQQVPRPLPDHRPPDLAAARGLVDAALAAGRRVLDEVESLALLRAFHVPVLPTTLARTADDAVRLAQQAGFPVAMKVAATAVAHKSDAGGVALNVRNAAEARARFHEILDAVRAARPDFHPEGLSVQPMRSGRGARELHVGVLRDPAFGPVIVFGAGGTRIETVRDIAFELPPLNRYLARRLIERTRIAAALRPAAAVGPRARQAAGAEALPDERDVGALEALLVSVSEMACDLPELLEMDINPVIVDEEGVVAADARVVLEPAADPHAPRHGHLAIVPWPGHLAREFVAIDGGRAQLRPIQPEDADLLQAFVRGLSAESRYLRFISVLSELPPRLLVRYTQIDYDREFALVALAPAADPRGRIVGVVRYLLNVDRESCEFAITLADDWQGRGLGATLMRSIVGAACAKGLRTIEGHVLATNTRMLALMRRLGFEVKSDRDDPTMKRVWMDFPAGPPEGGVAGPNPAPAAAGS
jgi:acetyltransferase